MQDIWKDFLNFQYSSEVLIAIGAILALIGFYKVVRNSIRIIVWVLLMCIGAYGVAYGVDRSSSSFTINLTNELKALVDPGREMSVEAMRTFCMGLDGLNNLQNNIMPE